MASPLTFHTADGGPSRMWSLIPAGLLLIWPLVRIVFG